MSYFLVACILLVICFFTQGATTLLFLIEKARWLERSFLVLTGVMAMIGIVFFAIEIASDSTVQYRRMALMGVFGFIVMGFLVPYLVHTFENTEEKR